ncbi:hypothetical protein Tco_0147429, partial [Tanacetum coccineum]
MTVVPCRGGGDVTVVVAAMAALAEWGWRGDDIDGGVLVVVWLGVRQRQEGEAEDGGRLELPERRRTFGRKKREGKWGLG